MFFFIFYLVSVVLANPICDQSFPYMNAYQCAEQASACPGVTYSYVGEGCPDQCFTINGTETCFLSKDGGCRLGDDFCAFTCADKCMGLVKTVHNPLRNTHHLCTWMSGRCTYMTQSFTHIETFTSESVYKDTYLTPVVLFYMVYAFVVWFMFKLGVRNQFDDNSVSFGLFGAAASTHIASFYFVDDRGSWIMFGYVCLFIFTLMFVWNCYVAFRKRIREQTV